MAALSDRERACYFVPPNPILAIVITFGLWLTWGLIYAPDIPPYKYLGPLGQLCHFLVYEADPIWKYVTAVSVLIIHVIESLIALYFTGKKGVSDPMAKFKWWICTLLFGYFTFRHLVKLKPKQQ
ncbi:transmembrane protein 254-like [Styela clava]|uniref:uncharacterized protein LOC120328596 n=1 Tax=Styela clava TaxID=7725 RepID=UPI00193A8851|nr:uncharacterized protein LOC120328596 [Styela clava]